jgi:hypothetical protein
LSVTALGLPHSSGWGWAMSKKRKWLILAAAIAVLLPVGIVVIWRILLALEQPARCTFVGASLADVGKAVAEHGGAEAAHGLFGGSETGVWSDYFKQSVRSGRGGATGWHVDHFLTSSDGKDEVGFEVTQDGCTVKLHCWEYRNGMLLPALVGRRYVERERSILQNAYWTLKRDNSGVAVRMEGSWQPSDPFIVELHDDVLWLAVKGVPWERVRESVRTRGFQVDSGSTTRDRVVLSGHFTADPFGALFQGGLFNEVKDVTLDETVLIKKQADVVVIGVSATGSGWTKGLFGWWFVEKTVTSETNRAGLSNLLWNWSMTCTVHPVSPTPYAEKLPPPTSRPGSLRAR